MGKLHMHLKSLEPMISSSASLLQWKAEPFDLELLGSVFV